MPETGTGKVNTTTLGWVSKTGQVRWSNTNNVSEGGKNKTTKYFYPNISDDHWNDDYFFST